MHIFIDESGIPKIPSAGRRNLACVGALVIPEARFQEAVGRFTDLMKGWGADKEAKGSDLNEPQIDAVINILIRCDAIFFVTATEMSVNDEVAMRDYQRRQAEYLTDGLTEKANQELRRQLTELRTIYEGLSSQLFVQSVLLTELVKKVIDVATLHFSFAAPQEAGAFKWMIDAKDKTKKTKYKIAWMLLAGGLVQSRNLESPGVMASDGDYSHFARFFIRDEKWPAHLPPPKSRDPSKPGVKTNLNLILYESLTFGDSEQSPGLQLADIVTNAFRRAMMGKLQPSGYVNLGLLMRYVERSPCEFHLFASQSNPPPAIPEYDQPNRIIKSRSRRAGT